MSPVFAHPPKWVESLLKRFLATRTRDTISGDLLEEYREVILPERGRFRARLWYVWQVATLVVLAREHRHWRPVSLPWLAAGVTWIAAILSILLSSHFAPPDLPVAILLVPGLLIGAALTSLRSAASRGALGRSAPVWAAMLILAAGLRAGLNALAPFDVEQHFLAQARSGFTEFQSPVRIGFGVLFASLLFAAGFHGARQTKSVRAGILTALCSALAAMASVVVVRVLDSPSPPAGFAAAAGISSVLGAAGAMFGKVFQPAPVV